MNRIFRKDGKTLIVAMDGAGTLGPVSGMRCPERTLESVVRGGADAVLATYGLIETYGRLMDSVGLILRCDGGVSTVEDNTKWKMLFGAEDALRLGADAVACNCFPRSTGEGITLEYLAKLVSAAAPWGLPVLAEALSGGFTDDDRHRTAEAIAFATRAASELGASFIKTAYTGSYDSFAEVVDSSYLPIVVLGGAATDEELFLRRIADAMRAGASGVAVGRQIWQHRNPEAMTRALSAVVHEQLPVEEAVAWVKTADDDPAAANQH
jgi:DhnA family fructose-bisphosphate aldolase class Ia